MAENLEFPPLYAVRGITGDADPQRAGEEVWLYWSEEGGGWYQWGPLGWRRTFETAEAAEKIVAGWCRPSKWSKAGVGPWYSAPTQKSIEVVAVPNPKTEQLKRLLREVRAHTARTDGGESGTWSQVTQDDV